MKIKLKSNMFGKSVGDVIDVSTSVGDGLIKSGDASPVKDGRKKVSNKAMSAKTE